MSRSTKPLISIITPSRNVFGTIRDTLDSVVQQQAGDEEHLLIDACSDDGTLDVAAQYPHLTVRSEPDRGIYDGMNKGASLSSGEWLLFLQADDWLPARALEAYRGAIRKNPDAEIICGGAEAVRQVKGKWQGVWSVEDDVCKKLSVKNIALGEPMVNARLIRRESFWQLGGFSPSYSLASDRDFLLRAAIQGMVQIEIPEMTYRYRWHAGSSTMTDLNNLSDRLLKENIQIAARHLLTVSPQDRNSLCRWHTRLRVQSAMNAIESGAVRSVIEHAVNGTLSDPLWPLVFTGEILGSLPGFLARGCITKSRYFRSMHRDHKE
jgi:glycosyltransferase involved in cell wall biosynthesis